MNFPLEAFIFNNMLQICRTSKLISDLPDLGISPLRIQRNDDADKEWYARQLRVNDVQKNLFNS